MFVGVASAISAANLSKAAFILGSFLNVRIVSLVRDSSSGQGILNLVARDFDSQLGASPGSRKYPIFLKIPTIFSNCAIM